jgi:transposase
MGIVIGLDVRRSQITFDWLDTISGEVACGQIRPATREGVRDWLEALPVREGDVALEATTGWRFVVEELERAGLRAHLAEPADTRALRGPKRRAKTDRQDARHLRDLLHQGRLPESWIPPTHIQEARTLIRLRQSLVEERTAWQQRIHAVAFHHGLPQERNVLAVERRKRLHDAVLPTAARRVIDVALRHIDAINTELKPLEAELTALARHQPACKALQQLYGVGWLLAFAFWAELGDVRRFGSSRQVVRFAGLDVTVWESANHRSPGKLSRQGSSVLRWAAYEAAQSAARAGSPDYNYYIQVKQRLGGSRAALAVSRKLLRRAYHILYALGDQALEQAA